MKKTAITLFFLLQAACLFSQIPRPEYPRPQFERTDWINLNGEWTYTFDFGASGLERGYAGSKGFDGKIIVPFAPESKLSGVGHTDFIGRIWYQRTIDIPADWSGRNVMLNFGAVYYTSEVYVDGRFVGRHFGGSTSFSYDITAFVKPGGSHSLVVFATSDLRSGKQTAGKQSLQYASHSCDYTRTTGIWQTVWMEAVAPEALARVQMTTDIDQQQLIVAPQFFRESPNTLRVTLRDGGKVVGTRQVRASNSSVVVIPVKKARLWSPEDPFLYDLTYEVVAPDGQVLDAVKSYVGMRKVHIEGNKIYLNNEPYYQRLVLDQGFYPDGIWTAPSDDALRRDIELSMAMGFNGARLHQKVFEERYYYWADKLGYITWGESASWGVDVNDEVAARNFLSEWSEVVARDRNHPSLVTWTPLNETWSSRDGEYTRFVRDIYNVTKAIDPTRPVNDASGDDHVVTDIWTVHNYEADGNKLFEQLKFVEGKEPYRNTKNKPFLAVYEGQPYMVDEFGGIGWMSLEERKDSWGYGGLPQTEEEFYSRLEGQIKALKASEHVVGFCYTQLTDVEQEKNGIYYYDRRPKLDMKRIKAIFELIPSTEEEK